MIPPTAKPETEEHIEHRHLNILRGPYPDETDRHQFNLQRGQTPENNMDGLNYHSSILHLYHQQMNHSSLLASSFPPSSPQLVTLVGGFPNLHHVSILETEYQRQLRLQAELHGTGTFSHLSGISLQPEELPNLPHMLQIQAVDNTTCINIPFTSNSVDKSTKSKADCNVEQNSDSSFAQSRSKAQSSKKERQSKPIVESPQKVDAKWHASYEELKKYKELHGNTIVPRGYSLNSKLASWVRLFMTFVSFLLNHEAHICGTNFFGFTCCFR